MSSEQITYLVFGIVLVLALVFDLGLLSKRGKKISIRQALYQTFFWVGLAFCLFYFFVGTERTDNSPAISQWLPDGMES
jgi:tellurite resistance protein TerC